MERINMIQKPYRSFFLICTAFVMTLSACASPEAPAPTLDVNEIVNQVAATIEMGFTQTALAMPTATNTPEPTITPIPSATLQPLIVTTPTVAASPTLAGPTPLPVNPATANGCYNAALVSEGTVPNRTDFKSGDTFQKTWRLINTGTCDWNGEFKIAHVSGDYFGSDTTKIRQRVGVGIIADVSLDMEAPSGSSGTVVSNWQMVTDTGLSFGPLLTVSIILPGTNATATSVGCYSSALVSDVTIPKGTKLDPGEQFTKAWQIKNSGTCDWTSDFKITFVGGNLLNSDTTKIRQRVPAGSTAEISLPMVAPSSSGSYTSSWQMANDNGDLFGQVFTIEIVVR
jgi:hypothetical protein